MSDSDKWIVTMEPDDSPELAAMNAIRQVFDDFRRSPKYSDDAEHRIALWVWGMYGNAPGWIGSF